MFFLADCREQAIAQLPVGCGDGIHLGPQPLTQRGERTLPGSRVPDLLGQYVVLGAGQGTGAMSGNQLGEDGGEAGWRRFITARILTGSIDSLGAVLVVGLRPDSRRGVVFRLATNQQDRCHAGGEGRETEHCHP
ncbi:hypothetical protein D3C77_524390 [compost metagenome]